MQSGRVGCAATLRAFAIEIIHQQVCAPYPHQQVCAPCARAASAAAAAAPALTVWLGQAATSLAFVTSGHAAPTAENAALLDAECEGTLCGNHVAKVCGTHERPTHVPPSQEAPRRPRPTPAGLVIRGYGLTDPGRGVLAARQHSAGQGLSGRRLGCLCECGCTGCRDQGDAGLLRPFCAPLWDLLPVFFCCCDS